MYTNSWAQSMMDFPAYSFDAAQRSILFMDSLRKRGNIYLDHLRNGQPPVLVFDYEMVLDGRTFERPVNYALVRIEDRRETEPDRRSYPLTVLPDKLEHRRTHPSRRHKPRVAYEAPEATSRPIIIFDPRAGHGPGIGGSKQDSQIGMALDAGHPVYFLIFSTSPFPGQTLTDVRNAQIRFVHEVRKRHIDSPRPAIIGNCQGGWAAALVGAERPGLVGPMAFNGSPLSYWAGVVGVHPLRYLGGLLGGVWITSLLSDLGNGYFDGANLVANFENLNPANTLWNKYYHLYANVDTEEQRFLDFERWWGGFFLLSAEEIHQTVDGLFIGNKLERGEFELEDRRVDLRHNDNPVVLFASFGDNITPPQQAFNWIIKTYGSVAEIKRRGQVIVYIVHSSIGHLGIFVSAKIARKEHKKIIASFDMLYHLAPGLYQMQIDEDPNESGEYIAHYVEKKMEDIIAFDDGLADEDAFLAVREFSELLDAWYRATVSPWIRMSTTDFGAEARRQLHPMRVQRVVFSDLNPWMHICKVLATQIKNGQHRKEVKSDNAFRRRERIISSMVSDTLNVQRDMYNSCCEMLFKTIYENPWLKAVSNSAARHADEARRVA